MNTKTLAKMYDLLTPFERLPLIIAASERGDDAEADRLSRSAPRVHLALPDYHGLGDGLQLLSLFHVIGQLELGLLYWHVSGLAADWEEFVVDAEDKARAERMGASARLGVLLAEVGRLEEATALLRRAAELRPGDAAVHQTLGVALAQQAKADEAARALEEAVRLRPDYAEAWYNLGNVLQGTGRRDEAMARYREAVRLRPQAVEGHNNLGLAYTALGRFAEAEMSFREALRLDPGYVEGHNNLGSVYKEQGRLEEGLACLRDCLDHVIVFDETHLRRVLSRYFDYHHNSRTHRALDDNAPCPRAVEPLELGRVVAIRQVGGLHHRYTRVA